MNRRHFLTSATAFTAGASLISPSTAAAKGKHSFKLNYAPHPRMFRHHAGDSVLDQIEFAADQGFTAWEDNGLSGYSPDLQEQIGATLDRLGMTMGVFVAYGSIDRPTFAVKDESTWEHVLTEIRKAIEVAKRVNARWCTVVPGSVDQQYADESIRWNKSGGPRLAQGYQTANVIELLRRCSELLEPHELVMVLEPLNWHANHGGAFLRRSDQAYALCKAVDSPSCKILFDIYHQQITEGNIIPNLDQAWDEIAYLQIGDNPGRNEPGTGEINYRSVFRHLHSNGYKGVLGMEHGNSKRGIEGEQAVIDAYLDADDFEV